ncbi:MAG: DNA gyrase subunit A [Pseudomonadota bacterium]
MSATAGPSGYDITPITIEEEMKRSYLDYAMSVIVSRALPDVRDGLKPVHRRILYAMKEGGYDSTKSFKKSSRIVGDVMGKYHPHGDAAIYEAMVRMAQDFSMRLPLIDGQGNFGSMDGDPPAAMRYTEARLAKSAESMLDDIDKDTVDFQPNYDESQNEPIVLPSRFPNLLVNGAGGIAVGMATNIPPHNLGEVIDACCAVLDDPELDFESLVELVPGPDFPTGAIILGRAGIRSALATGRGSVVMRGRTSIEDIGKDRQAIIVTEIPYQVNKSRMIERIAEVVQDKTVEGISDLRDESDRDGVRVVIELRRDAVAEVVLNQLFRFTPLQTSFGVNMLALNNGKPELLHVRQVIDAFLAFRREVIARRTAYELRKARERAHLLVGLAVAVANVDEVVALIRASDSPEAARAALMEKPWPAGDVAPLIALIDEPDRQVGEEGVYRLTETQARGILDLRLHRLTGLEREKIGEDLRQIVEQIGDYLDILGREERLVSVLRDELIEIKERFATPRRTEISDVEFEADIEDLIKREEMVVTVTNSGYVKRVALDTYRAQRRGGKGRSGMSTKDEDFVTDIFVANTHIPLLLFSSRGIAYKLKVYRLPVGTPQARGKAFVNLLPLEQGETITTVMPLPEDEETWADLNVVFATQSGGVRRNRLSDFVQINRNGKIAMKLDEGDSLIGVRTCEDDADVMLATRLGKCIRFALGDIRVFSGRTSTGVRGIKLADGDEVISMSILKGSNADATERAAFLKHVNALRKAEGEEDDGTDSVDAADTDLTEERIAELMEDEELILTISAEGFGKRTSSHAYRRTNRGGQGIWNMEMGDRNTAVAGCFPVSEDQEMILATDGGQVIRCPVNQVRLAARKTLGVTIFKVDEDERVVSVAAISDPGENEDSLDDGDDGPADEAPAADPPEKEA